MSPILALVIFAAVVGTFFFFGDQILGRNKTDDVEERINYLIETNAPEETNEDGEEGEQLSPAEKIRAQFQERFGSKIDSSSRNTQLTELLVQANIKLRASEWIAIRTGVGIFLALVFMIMQGSLVSGIISGVIVFLVSQFAARFFLRSRAKRRQSKFDKQLGDVIIALASNLKAGNSFAHAMEQVAQTAAAPANAEFQRFTREVALGVPFDDALQHLVERNGSEDLELMMTAVQIQRTAGGNLAEILDNIGETIRERIRIKAEIRTLTAPGRAQGWIITALPAALAGMLSVLNPAYFNKMFTTTVGNVLLGIAGFSILMGYLIIRKIVNVKV